MLDEKMNFSEKRMQAKVHLSKKGKPPPWPPFSTKLSAIEIIIIAVEDCVKYFGYI